MSSERPSVADGTVDNTTATQQFKFLLLTHSSTDILALTSAKRMLPHDFPDIEATDICTLKNDGDMVEILNQKARTASSVVIIVRLLGRGVPGFQSLLDYVRKEQLDLIVVSGISGSFEPDLTAMCTVSTDIINEVIKYFHADGCCHNMFNMLRYLADTLMRYGYGYDPPTAQPDDGLYHPHFAGNKDRAKATALHLETCVKVNDKPTVVVIFYRCHFLSGNTSFVDALIDELEAQGMNAIGLFAESLRDNEQHEKVNGKLIERFPIALKHLLNENGNCLVNVVISTMAFAMGEVNPDGPTLSSWCAPALEALNVPILQAINSVGTRKEWEDSARGLNPLDTAMNVAIPEFDGRIITVPVSFMAPQEDSNDVQYYEPVFDRVVQVAKQAFRMSKLRQKNNASKRIGFVLTNSSGKAQRIGDAVGLDTPASIMKLFQAMQEVGYEFGDNFPSDGDTLIQALIDRCSYDEIVLTEYQLAHAAGRVPTHVYQPMFDSLPTKQKEHMSEQWGEPPGEAYVHQGAIALAGLEFGNIFMALQPPRGYGMDPDKIYHTPDLPPPHNYFALYRWLRDVWKADAIVHMGKHGTLEWLPGKGVGLSRNCYPDTFMDDLPLLYPFIINDPGEGMQSKRRAHALIIDHLTPPMTTADGYGELAQLMQLVDEYYQIEMLDPTKLPLIQKQIWALVEKIRLDEDLSFMLPSSAHDRDNSHNDVHKHDEHGHGHEMHISELEHSHEHKHSHEHDHHQEQNHNHTHDHHRGLDHHHKHQHRLENAHTYEHEIQDEKEHEHESQHKQQNDHNHGRKHEYAGHEHQYEHMHENNIVDENGHENEKDIDKHEHMHEHNHEHTGKNNNHDNKLENADGDIERSHSHSHHHSNEETQEVDGEHQSDSHHHHSHHEMDEATPSVARSSENHDESSHDHSHNHASEHEHDHSHDHWHDLNEGTLSKMEGKDFAHLIEDMDGYLCELAGAQIRDGLHILGDVPKDDTMVDMLQALTRLPNLDVPSLREAIAAMFSLNATELLSNQGARLDNVARSLVELADRPLVTSGDVIETIDELGKHLLAILNENQFQVQSIPITINQTFPGLADSVDLADLNSTLEFVCQTVVPSLQKTTQEITYLIAALNGEFVPSGPSGSPTRGMAHLLPTGRNFYSVDPQALPSHAAWQVGVGLADELLTRYQKETKTYPEHVAISVWGTAAMRTHGDDIAQIFALLGIRPTWQKENHRVTGVELIPLAELGRPRIDVTCRISGFFRDAFPHLITLLDDATNLAISADEPPDQNFIRKHYLEDITKNNMDENSARYRVFGCPPGAYGIGILDLIEAQNWKSDDDFARCYINWGGYAYSSKEPHGVDARSQFTHRLTSVEIAIHNQDDREHDIFDSDDYFQFHGGMIATIRALSGKQPKGYFGDSSNPAAPKVRDVKEETLRVYRTRVVNPKWLESIQRHGYKGASEMAATVDYLFGFDATANVMSDFMYEQVAQSYALDKATQDFYEQSSPWALRGISERLLEAAERGLWENPNQETLEALRDTLLHTDSMLEGRPEPTI